ncbi:AraC family transcriptional regulator [Vibrio sp. JC009]|uniref:helix-turn-helix domain-containing protein n=1 Tax=Vibrio sp. JC009 TaxID=2912314 RepID=UPI0023AF23D3|nr:AraC family transcriptional regulator [Vibrio sp. JC009]WED23350.1 AraC family transcriptional regulator [Vibrio sp. JC009]
MSNIVDSLNVTSDLEGQYDVITLDDGVTAYIVNCTARRAVNFNDPADAGFYISFIGTNDAHSPDYPEYPAETFAFRCIASMLHEPEPNNLISLKKQGKIESIRIHFPLQHSLTKSLLPESDSPFRPFKLYEMGWQMPLSGQVREVAASVWNNDFQGGTRALWLKGKIYELLALLMMHRQPKSLADKACERIAQQPYLNWNIPRLARELATNECYLKQSFRQQFNMGVAGWIQSHRIGLAKERLADPSETITQIALDLGYQSGSYFSKVFKQHTNLTPKEFRGELSGTVSNKIINEH